MSKELQDKVRKIMSEVFNVPVDTISDEIEIGDIEPWDSLGQLNLMLALEGAFSVHFTTGQVLELNSFRKIIGYLNESLN